MVFRKKPQPKVYPTPYTQEVAQSTINWVLRTLPDDWGKISGQIIDSREPQEGAPADFIPTELKFKPNEANCFWEFQEGTPFRGQDAIKEWIEVRIQALEDTERMKMLLIGMAGCGKTTFAWIVAKYLIEKRGGRFFELLPSQIGTLADLVRFVDGLQPYDVVFIDEVHQIVENLGGEPLFHILQDTHTPVLKVGGRDIAVDPTVTWLAATTDPGRMDKTTGGALRRRFNPIVRFEPPTVDTLVEILQDQRVPIDTVAALEIAERSNGLPWGALLIYNEARAYAKVAGDQEITLDHALRALNALRLDANGLNADDRAIIMTLLQTTPTTLRDGTVLYKMAKSGLAEIAGVDPGTFEQQVQPKLLKAGYLTVRGGMCLTPRAIFEYGHLMTEEGL